MSIEEESFPYDSLFDAAYTPSPTKFQLVSSETFNVFGCSSTFIADKNSTCQAVEYNNNNNNTINKNANSKSSSLKRLQSLNNSHNFESHQLERDLKENIDHLQSRCNYLCEILDEKYLDIARLKNNVNFLRIELLSSENRVRELQEKVPKEFSIGFHYPLRQIRKREIATQTDVNQTPTDIKSAFLFVKESSQIDDLNTTKIKKYNLKLQHKLSYDNYEEIILAHSAHYTCNRNKGSVPATSKITVANSTRSTTSTDDRGEERKSSSEQLSSSMRCSSDSAIELEAAEKKQKERLKLFQRRNRFKTQMLSNQPSKNNAKYEIVHDVYGDYRALEESTSNLLPVDTENNNNTNKQGILYDSYQPKRNPLACPNSKLFGPFIPCLQCLNRNYGNDASYFEMNLLGDVSKTN